MNALFPNGNFDTTVFAITTYLPAALHKLTNSVDPVISAALLALLGNTKEFSRDTGIIKMEYDDNGLPTLLTASMQYTVPGFRVDDVTEEAIAQDREFVLSYLSQLEGITLNEVTLSSKKGKLLVVASVMVGYGV